MTKKHFIALADVMRDLKPSRLMDSALYGARNYQYLRTLDELARFCKSQNPAFNRERWIDYINGECGPGGGKVKK